jgi:hypothetical protein
MVVLETSIWAISESLMATIDKCRWCSKFTQINYGLWDGCENRPFMGVRKNLVQTSTSWHDKEEYEAFDNKENQVFIHFFVRCWCKFDYCSYHQKNIKQVGKAADYLRQKLLKLQKIQSEKNSGSSCWSAVTNNTWRKWYGVDEDENQWNWHHYWCNWNVWRPFIPDKKKLLILLMFFLLKDKS